MKLREGHRTVEDDIITRECRANRGREGAWDEIVRRLRAHYDQMGVWDDTDAEIGLTLSLKRPEEPDAR